MRDPVLIPTVGIELAETNNRQFLDYFVTTI